MGGLLKYNNTHRSTHESCCPGKAMDRPRELSSAVRKRRLAKTRKAAAKEANADARCTGEPTERRRHAHAERRCDNGREPSHTRGRSCLASMGAE